MSDPYIDPQSGILRNKFGLTNQESLDRAEANSVSARSILLQLNPLRPQRTAPAIRLRPA
jgi:cell filamentation protein